MTDKALEKKFVNVFTTPNIPDPNPSLTDAQRHKWAESNAYIKAKVKPEITFDASGRPKGCRVPPGMNPFSSPIDDCMAKVYAMREEMLQQEFTAMRQYHETITPSLPPSPWGAYGKHILALNTSFKRCFDPHLIGVPVCVPSMYIFEIYKEDLREAFLNYIEPIRKVLEAGLKKYPSYHFASIDIAISISTLFDGLKKTIGHWKLLELTKKLSHLAYVAITFELNVDYYGRVYVGLGGEVGVGFMSSKRHDYLIDSKKISLGLDYTVTISRIYSPVVNKSMNQLGKNERGLMKKDIHGMLTGHEINGAVNIFGLFVKGWTYALEHGKISTDMGINPNTLELSLGVSAGGNYSWLISDY